MPRARKPSPLEAAQKRLAMAAVRFTECTAKLAHWRSEAGAIDSNVREKQYASERTATAERLLVLAEEELSAAAIAFADQVRAAAEEEPR